LWIDGKTPEKTAVGCKRGEGGGGVVYRIGEEFLSFPVFFYLGRRAGGKRWPEDGVNLSNSDT
jgi:hypothetical protein